MFKAPGKLLIATTNGDKLREMRQVLVPLGFEVLGLDSVASPPPEPAEDASTFEENARIKALAYARALGTTCIAEDSGLEVDALFGAPGVYSARYAAAAGTRAERTISSFSLAANSYFASRLATILLMK